jgi:hypothetical protein
MELPPFEDGFGKRWTLDGRCLNPDPPAPPSWIDEWPQDLRFVAFEASLVMELRDEVQRDFLKRTLYGDGTNPDGPAGLL